MQQPLNKRKKVLVVGLRLDLAGGEGGCMPHCPSSGLDHRHSCCQSHDQNTTARHWRLCLLTSPILDKTKLFQWANFEQKLPMILPTSYQIYFVITTQSKLIRLSVFLPFPLLSCCLLLAAEALFSSFNFLQTFLINFFHEINGCNNLAIRNSWLGWNSSNLFLSFVGLQRLADGT